MGGAGGPEIGSSKGGQMSASNKFSATDKLSSKGY